jgi:hypothetical protein
MAEHPLSPFKAKLDRADKSLRTFNTEYGRFSRRKPLRAQVAVDFQSGWNTAQITNAESPPPLLSVLIGESLYHGRSALEHLVWAMVKKNHKEPGYTNTFPIFDALLARRGSLTSAEAFIEITQRNQLAGVPVEAVKLVERCQPYHAPDASIHFLSILNRMARDDRHHALHGSYVGGMGDDIRNLFQTEPGVVITDFENLLRFGEGVAEGTQLARFRVAPLIRKPRVRVEGDLPTFIAFGERPSALIRFQDFHEINQNLRKVVSLFEQFV